ncbi:MAG: PEP-CTERM sorting domain-containing protein [Nitrospiraceae bacterium]|nr:PEP-CTERM sorting domain-containing protein [Nitrospiraceae bacterium]
MKTRSGIFAVMVMLAAFVFLFSLSGAQAATIQFDLDTVITGGTPAGSTPWARATVADSGPDTVTLTMENLLTSGQFISQWDFNLDPAELGNVTAGDFTPVSGFVANDTPPVLVGENQYQAGGAGNGGLYDIEFDWLTSHSHRFLGGNSAVYTITAPGLDAADFLFLSTLANGHDSNYYSAAHVQGIPPSDDSSWIGNTEPKQVPEPGTILLFGTGMVLAGVLSFSLRRQADRKAS